MVIASGNRRRRLSAGCQGLSSPNGSGGPASPPRPLEHLQLTCSLCVALGGVGPTAKPRRGSAPPTSIPRLAASAAPFNCPLPSFVRATPIFDHVLRENSTLCATLYRGTYADDAIDSSTGDCPPRLPAWRRHAGGTGTPFRRDALGDMPSPCRHPRLGPAP